MDRNKLIKFLIKVLISLFFIWWIVYRVDWLEVKSYLLEVNLFWIFIYIILYLSGILVSSYKWQFLARHKNINLSLGEFYKSYFAATFVNNFMPSFIGGDSFKIYQIGKSSGKFKEAASSVVMDRFTGLLGGMILVILFAGINFQVFWENKVLLLLGSLSLIGLIFVFFILEFFRNRDFKTPFKLINKTANKLIGEVNHYNGEVKIIWRAIFWSFLFNLIGLAGANYILFVAFGLEIGILNYLSVIFLASLISAIPISINNIGVKEWAYITFFGFFGLSAGAVVSVAITSRIIQMMLSFVAWPIYLREKKK